MGETMPSDDVPDSTIWRHLPPELLTRILHHLPLEVLYHFRCISYRFHSLPTSPYFCNSLSHSRSSHSYLLGLNQVGSLSHCPIRNPSTQSWRFLDLSFLQSRFEHFTFERWSSYDDRWGSSEFKGVASDGGVLCVSARIQESEQDAIFVCNPLTKAYTLLPLIEGSTWGVCLGLAIHVEAYGHYRVFATKHGRVDSSNKYEQRLYMYGSIGKTWKLLPKCPRFRFDAISGVVCNGVYYALYEDTTEDVLMSYDVDHEVWVDTGVVFTVQGFKKKLVVVGEKRLFCVLSARDGSARDLFVTIVEVNLCMSLAVRLTAVERVTLPEEGQLHYINWTAIGYRNAILLHTKSGVSFVFDLSEDVPEWTPLETGGNVRLPKLLVALTFDLRATVD